MSIGTVTPREAERYSGVAIVLHWLIAIAVLAMIPMGLWMSEAISDPEQQAAAYAVFQLHKSVGFTILALTVMRLVWRLMHPVPALPAGMPAWERFAARATHAAFYGLLLLLPLTGWIYVSAGWTIDFDRALNVATSWFGLVHIPHLNSVASADEATRRVIAFRAMHAHEWMAWGVLALAAAHIAAALKHHFHDRDAVLAGMAPWLKVEAGERKAQRDGPAALAAGAAAVVAICIVGGLAARPAPRKPAVPRPSVAAATGAVDGPVVPGKAAAWAIDRSASSIAFTGTHASKGFKGRFEDWEGHIWFDPADLAGSKVVAVVRTGSVKTGDKTQEDSLIEDEWFDPARFPTARFEASEFRAVGPGRYEAKGTLRIKAKTVPVVLPFDLKITGDDARMTGKVELDRTALDLGMYSDPSAEWVSQAISLTVAVVAKRGG